MTAAGARDAEPVPAARPAPPPRIFVGLKMAPDIAARLAEFAVGLERPMARPVAAADIHLTLVAPWNERSIPDAIDALGGIAARFGAFTLTFRHVGYGPQRRQPRLLWADCAASAELAALHAALIDAFGRTDQREFQPHVTLARIRGDGPAMARKHPIDQDVSMTQRIETIELFQSPPAGERGYRILASLPLSKTAALASPS